MRYSYLIALGSNLGNRADHLNTAIERVNDLVGPVSARSEFHRTAPVGNADQEFLNAAILCHSGASPQQCLTLLLEIERSLGRQRKLHWGNRTIDLDIVAIRDETDAYLEIETSELVVPHPYAHQRSFVLLPCAEIAPEWKIAGKSVAEWREQFS